MHRLDTIAIRRLGVEVISILPIQRGQEFQQAAASLDTLAFAVLRSQLCRSSFAALNWQSAGRQHIVRIYRLLQEKD